MKFFVYYDLLVGINLIVKKLFINIQEKWMNEVNKYKQKYSVVYLLFFVFVMFVNNIVKICNDFSFIYDIINSVQQGDGFKCIRGIGFIKIQIFFRKIDVIIESCLVYGINYIFNVCW